MQETLYVGLRFGRMLQLLQPLFHLEGLFHFGHGSPAPLWQNVHLQNGYVGLQLDHDKSRNSARDYGMCSLRRLWRETLFSTDNHSSSSQPGNAARPCMISTSRIQGSHYLM